MSKPLGSEVVRSSRARYRYDFVNYPRDVAWEEYDRARDTFVERIDGEEGVAAVYESGKPSTRGISDIDLVVIVDDDVEDVSRVRNAIEAAKTDEYYFFHGPEVLTRDVFRAYHSVLPQPKELHHLYGERLTYEEDRTEFTALAYLVDSLNTTYPREFLEFLFLPSLTTSHELRIVSRDMLALLVPQPITRRIRPRLDVRLAIHRLNSFRNDVEMYLEQYGTGTDHFDPFDASITELRQSWFENPDQEETLLARLEDSITTAFVLAGEVADHLSAEGMSVGASGREVRTAGTYADVFDTEWTTTEAERASVTNFVDRGIPSCHLPQVVSVNERIRNGDAAVTAPASYRRTLERRDEVAAKREASMESFKYHPLRAQYLSVVRNLNRAKIRLFD